MRRERIEELFYIRAICAFGIFMIHLSGAFALFSQYNSHAMHLGIFINQFFRFGTPVFMMISGFVLFYNYRDFKEFDFKNFCLKKTKYILFPYFIWSIFYYIIQNHGIDLKNTGIISFIKTIILGNAYPHLYFIFLIFQFYLLYPLFIKYFIKIMEKKPFTFLLICFIAQSIILVYEFSFKTYSNNNLLNFFNAYYWKSVFGWFYYFLIGGIIALHYKKVTEFIDRNFVRIIPFYIISVLLYIGEIYINIWETGGRDYYERYGSIRPTTMIYATLTMVILIKIGRKIHNSNSKFKPFIKDWGIYSLGIYFLHPFMLEFIKVQIISRLPSYLGYSRISTILFLILAGWTCTILPILLLSRYKLSRFVLGRVPPYRMVKIERILTLK